MKKTGDGWVIRLLYIIIIEIIIMNYYFRNYFVGNMLKCVMQNEL